MGLCSTNRDAALDPRPKQPQQPGDSGKGAGGAGKGAGDAYETIRIPASPDPSHLPPELQAFREQCAAGVRQAVAMVSALEHAVWSERSRRQQAEGDVGVLLAAVAAERGLAGSAVGQLAEHLRVEQAARAGAGVTIAAKELPQASAAATIIQKNVRGGAARKEYEEHLASILRGVDPALDPAALAPLAQAHVSAVNAAGGPARVGTLLAPQTLAPPSDAAHAQLRSEVDVIGKRREAQMMQDASGGGGDPQAWLGEDLDVGALLAGTLPAPSAAVIAALVRRCKELQAALVSAAQELAQAKLSLQGLREENKKVAELSTVRGELEAERAARAHMAATLSRLRAALTHQAAAANGGDSARHNPHIAAWYRKQYADAEFGSYPPRAPGTQAPPRPLVFDGPEAEVEMWEDLRASAPEPLFLPKPSPAPPLRYKDLLALQSDMRATAAYGGPDPLYTSPVPDTTFFRYGRDTPIVPVSTAAGMIRESLPPDTYMAFHEQLHPALRTPSPAPPGSAGATNYLAPGATPAASPAPPGSPSPYAPMYSVLPLMRDHATAAPPTPDMPRPPRHTTYDLATRLSSSPPPPRLSDPGNAANPYTTTTVYPAAPMYPSHQQQQAHWEHMHAPPAPRPGDPAPPLTVLSPMGMMREGGVQVAGDPAFQGQGQGQGSAYGPTTPAQHHHQQLQHQQQQQQQQQQQPQQQPRQGSLRAAYNAMPSQQPQQPQQQQQQQQLGGPVAGMMTSSYGGVPPPYSSSPVMTASSPLTLIREGGLGHPATPYYAPTPQQYQQQQQQQPSFQQQQQQQQPSFQQQQQQQQQQSFQQQQTFLQQDPHQQQQPQQSYGGGPQPDWQQVRQQYAPAAPATPQPYAASAAHMRA